MNISAAVAYTLCALVCLATTTLLLRSWLRKRSALAGWLGLSFAILTVSNTLLVVDLYAEADLSLLRAVVVAIGLGVLLYGLQREIR